MNRYPLFSEKERVLAFLCRLSSQDETALPSDFSNWCQALRWESLVDDAIAQRLGPLLLHAIQQKTPACVAAQKLLGPIPAAGMKRLQKSTHATWVASTMRQHALQQLHEGFEKHQIPFLLFKGMAYLTSLYPDASLRPMDDMDFVVRPEDQARVIEFLREEGFEKFAQEHFCAFSMKDMKRRIYLDLHTRISWAGLTDIATDSLFESAQKTSPYGYLVPGLVEQCLIHIYNQNKQQLTSVYVPLLSFLELDALVQRCSLQALQQRAKEWRMSGFLACSLWCLQELYADAYATLDFRDAMPYGLLRQWSARLARQSRTVEELKQPVRLLQRAAFLMLHMEDWTQRIEYTRTRLHYPFAFLQSKPSSASDSSSRSAASMSSVAPIPSASSWDMSSSSDRCAS